jgi:hypothetical protein
MASIPVDAQALSPNAALFGELLGLLQDEGGGQLTLNTGWFAAAGSELEEIPRRVPQLLATVQALLGTPDAAGPAVYPGARWFAIPNPQDGTPTTFYLVVPASGATGGTVGLGVMHPFLVDPLTIVPYGYLPLFTLSAAADPVFAATTLPLSVGIAAETTGTFAPQDGATFTAMRLDADLWLGSQAPSMKLVFDGLKNTTAPAEYDSLAALLAQEATVAGWLASVLLQGAYWLSAYVGSTDFTAGDVLTSACILVPDANGNPQLNLTYLKSASAEAIALNFLLGVLDTLAGSTKPIVPLSVGGPGSGIFVVKEDAGSGVSDYGVRLVVQDATLGGVGSGAPDTAGGGGTDGAPPVPGPALKVQMGKWIAGETDAQSWVARSLGETASPPLPGASVLLLQSAGQKCGALPPQITFDPRVELVSVGFDVAGSGGQPLLNVNGYTLGGAELRVYAVQGEGGAFTVGAAAALDGVGVPLGPAFATPPAGNNPVPANLLQSGSSGGSGGEGGQAQASGDGDPVNPTFSLSVGWVQGGSFVAQLYDADGKPAQVVTIPMQRAIGPLYCDTLGIGWVQDTATPANDRLSLIFGGGVRLSALDVELTGLSVGIPVTQPGNLSAYDLDLDGLGITFTAGDVELSGAFLKIPASPPKKPYAEYDGEALIKAGTFTLAALGSYAYVPAAGSLPGYASLFIFAILEADLGGPPFFYVTGVAAGFGYNRGLVLPGMDGVPEFPLVAGASDPTKLGAVKQADGSWAMPDPAAVVALLGGISPPQRGEYWFAAGVRFTSFDLVNSTALVTVEFGNELEIAVLGLSWISLPPPPAPGAAAPANPFAYAELGIEVVILPDQGVFSATAVLTPNSFVLDPACRLTGGFAFSVWFGSNPNAGQWVLTLGGYHPAFTPPSYFPQVPRLGFDWPMSGDVTVSGDAYFALTPSAVMAGGGLQVLFHSGDLKAWFKARMDALVQWAPFHFEVEISISIGASYRVNLLFVTVTLSVELGASLTLWGPPTGGQVHVSWFVISFTVGFGAGRGDAPAPLGWTNQDGTGFAQTLLPHGTPSAGSSDRQPVSLDAAMRGGLGAADDTPPAISPKGVLTVTLNRGLLTTISAGAETVWVVSPGRMVLSAQTTIPTTAIWICQDGSGTHTTQAATGYTTVGVRPMSTVLASSVLSVTLTDLDEGTVKDLSAACDFDWVTRAVDAAKWGDPLPAGSPPEPNTQLPGRLLGIANVRPKPPVLTPSSPTLTVDVAQAFAWDVVDEENPDHLPLSPAEQPAGPVPQGGGDSQTLIGKTLMDPGVQATRTALFQALRGLGMDPGTDGPLTAFAADPGLVLYGDPLVVPVS